MNLPHWFIVVDTEVRRERPKIPEDQFSDFDEESEGTEDEHDDDNNFIVASDSEDDTAEAQGSGEVGDTIYEEEIITYQRRTARPNNPATRWEQHFGFPRNRGHNLMTDDESARGTDDFPVLEV